MVLYFSDSKILIASKTVYDYFEIIQEAKYTNENS